MEGGLLLIAAAGLAGSLVLGPGRPRIWLLLVLAGCLAGATAALRVLGGADAWEWRSTCLVGGESPHLRLDAVSALFLVLVGVAGGATAIYSRGYWTDAEHPDSAPRSRFWMSATLLAMGFLLVCSNGLHFLIAWELFAIGCYFLITLDRRSRDVREAGWLYLAASHAGTLCLVAFFAALAARTGSWDLGPMAGRADLSPLFWLAVAGFGLKAGLFPLHIWLPSAHARAPSHVSAMLSGVGLKMGVYGLVRFSGWLPPPAGAGWVLIGAGAVGAVLGIALAFAQNDLKRLLAYCSVENIGIISIGIGGAVLGAAHGNAPWGRLLLAGALFHVWNHGLSKSLLFLGSGSVVHATGTREISRLGGLWRGLPWTAGLFALGAAAIAALPPLNGFAGEWLLYLGLFDAADARGPAAWAALPCAIILAMAGALALATFIKAGSVTFLGAPRTQAAAGAHECGRWMLGPMAGLAALCVILGAAPVVVWPALARAAAVWNPAWSAGGTPGSLPALSAVLAALAAAAVGGVVWLRRRAAANGVRRAPTWDCGYAAPSARMQATGGSFSGIAGGWFRWILRPGRVLHRPHGPFPGSALWVERMPEPVLERLVEPAGRAVIGAASVARRLQHGRLQWYVAYVVAGLAALGALVWMEGFR